MAEINLQKRVVYAGDVHIALLKSGWSIREACDFVNGLPKADVTEVRHGRWVDVENPLPWCEDDAEICSYCSLCGAENALGETEFCPNCGADMRGANDEQL